MKHFFPLLLVIAFSSRANAEGSYADIGLALEKAQLGGDLETEDSGMFRIQIVGTFDQNKSPFLGGFYFDSAGYGSGEAEHADFGFTKGNSLKIESQATGFLFGYAFPTNTDFFLGIGNRTLEIDDGDNSRSFGAPEVRMRAAQNLFKHISLSLTLARSTFDREKIAGESKDLSLTTFAFGVAWRIARK